MNPPFHITRIPFPATTPEDTTTTRPTRSQRGLVLKAIQGWGDPEQLTDTEAARLKTLCAQWFGLDGSGQLQARVWRDAVVFVTRDKPSVEHAIIAMRKGSRDDPVVLYRVNRGHRLVPAEHIELQYLDHVVGVAVGECGL